MNKDDEYDYLFKIVLIGDSAVGKSNLLSRFTRNEFNLDSKSTIGVEFSTRNIQVDSKVLKAQIWDTVTIVVLLGHFWFMISRTGQALKNVSRWYKELREHADSNITILLVGNKCDLRHIRSVTEEEGKQYAMDNELNFFETSALESTNVDIAFTEILKKIYTKLIGKSLQKSPENVNPSSNKVSIKIGDTSEPKKESKCC
ncbi:Rab GTPase ypt31 [Entomophthora muscae]|uniref:Rab GTPase ypt31 n=1 Tax=Entomophthora muscae TaxID=34485 RepID=A0ACC2U3M8_9FUNG|nr:Rab GTPase ypt31 [Entomophthora muscae]